MLSSLIFSYSLSFRGFAKALVSMLSGQLLITRNDGSPENGCKGTKDSATGNCGKWILCAHSIHS
jgi:hypothetical protein